MELLLLLLFMVGAELHESGNRTAVEQWTHHTVLDREGLVQLSWLPEEDRITFLLEVEAHGYVGLGFSPGGGMHGADMVLGWVTDGRVTLQDRHGEGNNVPELDASQDVSLDWGRENDTHTVLQFHRAWDTCDPEDLALGSDTVRLIWTYSQDDPVDGRLLYHGLTHRGARSIFLAEPPLPLPEAEEDLFTWDLTADNLLLPAEDHTHYWCKIYRAPELATKHHMVALQPLIQAGHESYVHHMVLYECHVPEDQVEAAGATTADWFQRHVNQPGEPCYSPNMPAEWSFCLATNAWAWAVGSEGEVLPEHTGMPLGEEWGGATYFMLETHYDNPALHAPLIDSSGLRIRYTPKLRQYDTGMMLIGSEVNFLQMVPPRQKLFTTLGHCSGECTEQGIPETGIRIISGVLHSHLAGRKMRLRHVRNGIELPVILEDNHYDFNFQASRVPKTETIVYPGDHLLLECEYETSTRDQPTFGGLSTRDEMCLVFVLYYPRAALADCRSLPALHTLTEALGIKDIYGHSFEKLALFMKDIGDATMGASSPTGESSLSSLLQSLARETGYTVPSLPHRPSTAPLTEEELLAKPFYTVATPKPDLGQDASNYRTLLMDLLMQIRIKSPASLNNLTVGELLVTMDWEEQVPTIQRLLERGEHNSLCLAHGRKPLIPYQATPYPEYRARDRREGKCQGRGPPRQSLLQRGSRLGVRTAGASRSLSPYIVLVMSFSILVLLLR